MIIYLNSTILIIAEIAFRKSFYARNLVVYKYLISKLCCFPTNGYFTFYCGDYMFPSISFIYILITFFHWESTIALIMELWRL